MTSQPRRLPCARPKRPAGRRGAPVALATVVAAVVLAGCGGAAPSGDSAGGTGSASSSAPSSSAPQLRTLRITVTDKQVTPAPARVPLAQGERLRLIVTVNHDDEVHVHGFEVEREAKAGQPVVIDLTGAEPGLYEVETHHPSLRLLQLLVR